MNPFVSKYYTRVYDYFCGAPVKPEKVLNPDIPSHDQRHAKRVRFKKNESGRHTGLSKKIDQLFDKGQRLNLLENIIVHGSYGDYTANNYSDLDITIMFQNGIFCDKSLLLKARRFVLRELIPLTLRMDPFQHHGPFILWPELLNGYDESILPTAVYEYAWASVEKDYTFHIPNSCSNKDKLYLTCDKVYSLGQASMKTRDLYLIKRFLSNVMLLPAFFQLAQGHPCHKATAYKRFQAEMGSFDALDLASKLRANWPDLNYYKKVSRLFTPLFRHRPLLSGVVLGRFSRVFPHGFCMGHVRKIHAELESFCSALTRIVKNG
jgi:hypothetical protein